MAARKSSRVRGVAPIAQRLVYGVGAAGVVLLALWNINFYFREYTPRNRYGWASTEIGTAAGRYLAQQRDPVFAYFYGAPAMYYNNASIRLQAPNVAGMDVAADTPADALPPPPAGQRPIFIFVAQPSAELTASERRYPNSATQTIAARSGNATLLTIYAPPKR